jgi:hypothetical protein
MSQVRPSKQIAYPIDVNALVMNAFNTHLENLDMINNIDELRARKITAVLIILMIVQLKVPTQSFASTRVNVPRSTSTSSSALVSTHMHPSSLTSHLIASSGPISGSAFQEPSSHAFFNPRTWLRNGRSRSSCARRHAMTRTLVAILPIKVPANPSGLAKRPPYSLLMIKIGRSGCAFPSFCSNFFSNGRWILLHSVRPRSLIDSMLDSSARRDGIVLSKAVTHEGRDARKALSIWIVRGVCSLTG